MSALPLLIGAKVNERRRIFSQASYWISPVTTGSIFDLASRSIPSVFTRASTTTFFNKSGVLATAAINEPVIEYDPATGACLGLRIWDAVTNLVRRSAEIDDTSLWLRNGSPTITADALVSPDGNTNAELIAATAAFSGPLQFISQTTGTTYTASAFIKDGGGANKTITIGMGPQVFGSGSDRTATFNVSTGVLSAIDPVYTSTFVSQPVNGWRRVALTYTTSVTASSALQFYGTASNALFGLYGAQLNTGPLAPYVPTAATTVSTAADVMSVAGSDFTRIYNPAEFTVYANVSRGNPGAFERYNTVYRLSDGTPSNGIGVLGAQGAASGAVVVFFVTNGVPQTDYVERLHPTTTPFKIVHAAATNDARFGTNGVLTPQDSSVVMPTTINKLNIGSDNEGGQRWSGYIQEFALFRSRRSNRDLILLSQ